MLKVQSQAIFKRKKNGKNLPYYYCRFIFDDDSEKVFSTKMKTKYQAREVANQWLKNNEEKEERLSLEAFKLSLLKERQEIDVEKNRLESLRQKIEKELNIPTIAEYVDFFTSEGKWVEAKRSRGINVSERHCLDRSAIYKNHLLPYWKDYRVSEITPAMIADFRIYLHKEKGLAGNTINKILESLKDILENALLNSYIPAVPLIQRFTSQSKDKGILNADEKSRLFNNDWESIWCRPIRQTAKGLNREDIILSERDKLIYAINLFSYDTGCRLGECQAVRINKIDFKKRTVIIDSARDNRCHKTNERTKTGIIRVLPLTKRCINIILEIIKDRNDPEAYVFSITGERPLEKNSITNGMYKALNKIGISEEERGKRNITFHSYRYMFNSDLIEGGIAKELVQKSTGHVTDEMTLKYLKISDLDKIRNTIENRVNNDSLQ